MPLNLLPVAGYVDDLGALMLAIGAVALNIDSMQTIPWFIPLSLMRA